MVMTSGQISGMIAGQQAMFGNFASYAQQITPPYGMGPGMGGGAPPPTYQPFTGAMMGPPPMPPPMPMQSAWGGQGMAQMAMAPPGAYGQQALAERALGTGFAGLSTLGSGMSSINAGAGIASMFGIGGAGMAAVGGLPVMAGLMAGQHVAEQGYQGFQERQGVNRVLRGRFGGQMGVGGGRGGTGFSTEEMGGISQMVREMGTQDLFTNMEELTRVMDRTAGMGVYRGVQSARQFKEKFQQTVDTLREIATTMQTSLEGATEFMDSSRRMGFVSGQDISRQLQATRLTSAATGIGAEQLQQAQGQGAQMARMWGARGRTGANTMRRMMTTVNTAQQTGVLSAEDVEFATGGLSGDEASAALAGRMMETNQRWLQSGAGRVMLAGIWDPQSGGINRGVMARVQSGQITMGQLREMGRRNIAQTGGRHSDFFLREQELRGQAQEAGGGQTLFMAEIEQHLQSRGIDMRSPEAQRFVMRRAQVTAPEAQAILRMHEEAPRLEEEMMSRERGAEDQMAIAAGREGAGIKGLGRRIGRFWEQRFQDPFRAAADRLTTTVTKGVEQTVDRLEGRVKAQISRDAEMAMLELAEFGAISTPGLEGTVMNQGQLRDYASSLRAESGGRGGYSEAGAALGFRGETVRDRARALGGFEQGGGLEGVSIKDTARIQDWVNQQSRAMSKTSAEFGFSTDQMKQLGDETRDIAFRQLDTETARSSYEQHSRGMGAKKTVLSRWKLMEKTGSIQLKSAMARARTFEDKVSLLGQMEIAGHLERGFESGAAHLATGRMGDFEFETMEDITAKRQQIYADIAGGTSGGMFEDISGGFKDLFTRGVSSKPSSYQEMSGRWGRLGKAAAGAEEFATGRGTLGKAANILGIGGESIRRATAALQEGLRMGGGMAGEVMFGAADVESVMQDEEVSSLLRQWKLDKNSAVSLKAHQRLQAIASQARDSHGNFVTRGDLTESQRGALGTLLERSKDDKKAAQWLEDLAKAAAAESGFATSGRSRELGESLRGRLDELKAWTKGTDSKTQAGMEHLRRIAALREKGDERGAVLSEREFYAAYGGTEAGTNILAALKEGKGGEYEALGLGRAGRAVTEYMSLGEGSTKLTRRIMEDVLGKEGLQKAGYAKDRDINQMVQALQSGNKEQVAAIREKLLEAGSSLEGRDAEQYRKRIEQMVERAKGGYSRAELGQEVAGAAAGAAEEARLRGAPEEKMANAAGQKEQVTQLKAIAMNTAKLAGYKPASAEEINAAMKSALEPTPAANK